MSTPATLYEAYRFLGKPTSHQLGYVPFMCASITVLCRCVNLGAFESQKVVTFVPPDGEFELMR